MKTVLLVVCFAALLALSNSAPPQNSQNSNPLRPADTYFLRQLERAFPNGVLSGVTNTYNIAAAMYNLINDAAPLVEDPQLSQDIQDFLDVLEQTLDRYDSLGLGISNFGIDIRP